MSKETWASHNEMIDRETQILSSLSPQQRWKNRLQRPSCHMWGPKEEVESPTFLFEATSSVPLSELVEKAKKFEDGEGEIQVIINSGDDYTDPHLEICLVKMIPNPNRDRDMETYLTAKAAWEKYLSELEGYVAKASAEDALAQEAKDVQEYERLKAKFGHREA